MNLALLFDYLHYLTVSVTEHGIHSPFVFKLTTEAIRTEIPVSRQQVIEACRRKQLQSKSSIEVTDLGTAYGGKRHYTRSIASIAKHSSKPLKYAELLFRLSSFLKPGCILELGTSFGYSTMYLSAGQALAKVITIEGCPNTAAIARKNFSECGFTQIDSRIGNFDDLLPEILKSIKPGLVYLDGNHQYEATLRYFSTFLSHADENTVLIFDDIYWSEGMKKAWMEIQMHPQVSASVDVFMFGLVFFRKGMSKQHFKVRY
ncbi:MAG: class I SAM-dependent methyltransferase [Bacteroidia bacterium]|nr:class I SAM-dependent methyltransferase [Bacteroidia bacterium]